MSADLTVGDTAAFLRWTHAQAIDAGLDARVVISRLNVDGDPVRARYTSKAYRLDELDDAAVGAHRISDKSRSAFCRVHLLDRDLASSSERGPAVATRWVTHFAADVDIAGPGHTSTNLPPDLEAAVAIIDATLPPSAIVSSGGGLYPIWRFAEVVEVVDDDIRDRLRSIGRRLDAALGSHGYHVDPTVVDLSRIIRPPGVMNHKPGREPRPVTVLRGYCDGAGDYSLDDIDRRLPTPPTPIAPARRQPSTTARPSTTSGDSAPWHILDELYELDDILAADPIDQWEQVDDQYDGKAFVPAWLRVGSSADYSVKAGSDGAMIVWSSALAARLGIDPGGGISRWSLLCAFAGLDPSDAARWSR